MTVLDHHGKEIAHCLEQASADKRSHMDVGPALGELVMGSCACFPHGDLLLYFGYRSALPKTVGEPGSSPHQG